MDGAQNSSISDYDSQWIIAEIIGMGVYGGWGAEVHEGDIYQMSPHPHPYPHRVTHTLHTHTF